MDWMTFLMPTNRIIMGFTLSTLTMIPGGEWSHYLLCRLSEASTPL